MEPSSSSDHQEGGAGRTATGRAVPLSATPLGVAASAQPQPATMPASAAASTTTAAMPPPQPPSSASAAAAVPVQSTQEQQQLSATGGGDKSPSSSSLKQEFLRAAPRDATHGMVEGVKSIALGVGAGVGALVGAPIIGAQNEGVKGFFKGLGAGVLGAIAMPVAGVVTGVGEMVGGLANTPGAVSARLEGRTWDPIQRQWVRYSLPEEAARVTKEEEDYQKEQQQQAQQQAGVQGGGAGAGGKRVKETRLYDLLEVAPDASAEEVKKAYYKAARRCHPDKNPGDAAAHEKFQALSQAYQILSNDQLRAAYDKDGEEAAAVADTPFVDPAMFFNVLFGSERFEPYVGRLKLSHVASAFGDVLKGMDPAAAGEEGGKEGQQGQGPGPEDVLGAHFQGDRAARVQNLREVRIATHLAGTVLAPFVAGDREGFHAWMSKEAELLAEGAFGPQMLVEVGWAYESTGREYLGYSDSFLGVEGWLERFAREAKGITRQVGVAGAAVSALRAAKGLHDSLPQDATEAATAAPATATGGNGDNKATKPPPTTAEASSAPAPGSGSGSEGQQPAATTTQQQEEEQRREREAEKAVQERLPVFVQLMWRMSALDVQKTVARAARKVCKDTSCDQDVRRRRAQALILLGAHFQAVGKRSLAAEAAQALEAQRAGVSEGEAAAKRLEEALQRAMAVQQGQEV